MWECRRCPWSHYSPIPIWECRRCPWSHDSPVTCESVEGVPNHMTKESAPPPYVDRLRPICPTLSRVPGELQGRPPTLTAPKWERVKRFLTSIFLRFENFCVPYKQPKIYFRIGFRFCRGIRRKVRVGNSIFRSFNLQSFALFDLWKTSTLIESLSSII